MKKIFPILLLALLTTAPPAIASSSVIHNSVSVSADNGVSTTQVKTVINGEVVEDTTISTTTPHKYESRHTNRDGLRITYQNQQAIITDKNDELSKRTQLTALLNELRTLLAYYEKLLAQQ